jgi:hypothetical protein
VTSRRGRGRRDNGLDAPLWSPLRDVDPRVGEHLLDVLSAAGIAAYLEPSADVSPYTRTVFLPSPPSDRLFVDRARHGEARSLIEQQVGQDADPRGHRPAADGRSPEHPPARESGRGPDPERARLRPDLDEDAEWARIVAAFEAEQGPPVAEPVDDAEDATATPAVRPAAPLPLPPPPHEPAILDRPEEHYEPPLPPPMPAPAPASLYATILVAGGLFLVGAPGLVRLSTDVGLFLGVAAIAAGVAMFLSRMRDRSDDDGDDGAVV